ncbi:pyridine nucleotide-disulfide oxidoreductase [Saccharobesus litoralis]|uniref:Pyridine nucleotide-disulfide oxidoreductase n=1 Tax=Saccharobesus litoralis TaxID=2172099 RepID=A0A2S0VXJ0_9ALTE|nr:FAD-dependent oxidoreductase [Saccharobesus litoralis]AWB68913.1 pyridine nucleotide-disulfide oxidoreductase [Saccharobesus litoralis]
MSEIQSENQTCVVIGASHGGVNLAFSLRKEGWQGDIILFDVDPTMPYHRPPLSKAYLTSDDAIDKNLLKSPDAYEKNNIQLKLGVLVESIDRQAQTITLQDGSTQAYDKLVFSAGARPIIPPIPGIKDAANLYPLRTAADVNNIRQALNASASKRAVVIGGGYIGLETAASMKKLGATVTVLEREERILARVTAPHMSNFFQQLHADNDVDVFTGKNVVEIKTQDGVNQVICGDGTSFTADLIVVGVGIRVNTELAAAAGLEIDNGVKVDETARTNDENIYAIGDCSFHHNPRYDRYIRLESVQNAVDQAKTAAAAICGKQPKYDTIPWFWSDQYDIKLQMVGLSTGYTDTIVREEIGDETKFSVWYFKNDELLAVDAVNNAKAYVLGTKFIKGVTALDKAKIADPSVELKPANLLAS